MTVAIGLVCADGVLVASDSMASNGPVAEKVKKVHSFGTTPAIWTMAGSVFVAEEVAAALTKIEATRTTEGLPMAAFTTPTPEAIRSKLKTTIGGAMREAYGNALNVAPPEPGKGMTIPFPSDFLVMGFSNDVPWFLEFDKAGEINWHTEGGFYSIGSGGYFATVANALMSHYLVDRPLLRFGKLVAYRAIETTIQVSSQMVGLPVQMAICDAAGPRVLERDELDAIGTEVAAWKESERDALFGRDEGVTQNDLPTLTAE